jgi:hypothetical protein
MLETFERFLEQVYAHTVRVHLDLNDVGLVAREHRHCARIGGRLADHDVAWVDQGLCHQVDHLLAAGGDDHLVRIGAHSFLGHHRDDSVLRLLEALGGPVLKCSGAGVARDLAHQRSECLGGERRRVGQSARERDHLGAGGDRHQVPHRRRPHLMSALREQAGVAFYLVTCGVMPIGHYSFACRNSSFAGRSPEPVG